MSEYQYYEFRAIDTPLTKNQIDDVSKLSSRTYVTSHSASFVYNYSDFPGNTEKLMTNYFDVMLYMSNWGTRQLIFRLPTTLVDIKQFGIYCISEEIDSRVTNDKEYILLEFDFQDEGQVDWIEGEGWLGDLMGLREELINGDYRVLYLAWLKAAGNAYYIEDIDSNIVEPPVPDGLGNLSPAQKTFAKYLEINKAMIAVGSQNSSEILNKSHLEPYIEQLPLTDQYNYLIRLSRGEKNLSALLNKHLQKFANQESQHLEDGNINRRTISALIDSSNAWRENQKLKEQHEKKMARQRELESLVSKKNIICNCFSTRTSN